MQGVFGHGHIRAQICMYTRIAHIWWRVQGSDPFSPPPMWWAPGFPRLPTSPPQWVGSQDWPPRYDWIKNTILFRRVATPAGGRMSQPTLNRERKTLRFVKTYIYIYIYIFIYIHIHRLPQDSNPMKVSVTLMRLPAHLVTRLPRGGFTWICATCILTHTCRSNRLCILWIGFEMLVTACAIFGQAQSGV